MSYQLKKIRLDLKVNWKISRNESFYKENYILACDGYESEIAPNIRYGETAERIEKEFSEFKNNPDTIAEYWCNSFKNAVVNLDLKRRYKGNLEQALGLTIPQNVLTSYSIPIVAIDRIEEYLELNSQYDIYKIKVDETNALQIINQVSRFTDKKLRVDANEGFSSLDSYLDFEREIQNKNIEFIEQPFKVSMEEEYKTLKPLSIFPIIADESVENSMDINKIKEQFHGVNIKLMKAGGLRNAKELLLMAKSNSMKTMVGCMIESSLGISEALVLTSLCDYCDLDGAILTKNDPYKDLINYQKSYLSLNN